MKRKATVFLMGFVLALGLCAGALAAQVSVPLEQMYQMTVRSVATWENRLLILAEDGLYLQRGDQLERLAGDYHVGGVETIPEHWAQTQVYPPNPDPCPDGSTICQLIVSRQGKLYSLSERYLGVNEIAIADGRADTRRVCVPDMRDYITAIDNGPYFVDAAVDGNVMYFVCGPDPTLPDVFPFGGDKILACDLESGRVWKVADGEFSGVCVTQAGELLATTFPTSGSSRLLRVDPETGQTVTILSRLPMATGYPREDPETERIYIASQRAVYGGDPGSGLEKIYELNDVNQYGACYHPTLGYVVVVRSSVDTQEAAARRKPLVIQGEPDPYTSQYNLETGSQVQYAFEFPPDSEVLAQSLLVQDGSVDLYRLRYDGSVRRLMERGYYTPLQEEPALAESAERLRPFFRAAVQQGGDLACFPLQMTLHGPAYDPALVSGEIPDTWEDWLRYLIRKVEADPDGNQPLFEANYSSSYLRDTLMDLLMEQYWLACDSVGAETAMETLRLNLSLALELCEIIPEGAFSDDSPLFRMRYAYVAAAMDENLSPLLLAFVPDTQPQRAPVLDVYLLNPYGEHRETALAYLRYIAQAQSGWLYASLYQADEPVEQADYRQRLQRLEKQETELTQALQAAAPEDARALQEQLDAVAAQRQALEGERWEVDEPALARYHAVLDALAFPLSQPPADLYDDILYSLKARRMDVDAFCQELSHRQRMWLLESGGD